jgi:PDZ domain-containing protein
MRLARLPAGRFAAGGIFLLALAAFFLWILPSPDYLYLPNKAKPLDGKVQVEGGRQPADPGGIYYLDVTIRRASWLEHVFAFTRPDGATLVPRDQVVPKGSTFAGEHQAELEQMDRSERVAAAVALRQAGFKVTTKLTGVVVEAVAQDVPATPILRTGDLIVSVDGRKVRRAVGLRAGVARHAPGQTIELGIRRQGKLLDLNVKTVADPQNPKRPLLGIVIAQGANVTLPIRVNIDLGGVGGPSAGLPFALDVLEQLGHDVDHGYKVAATGELDLNGMVRPIGGVKQKTFGARKAGADVLLVPAGDNEEEARRYAGGLRVIPVESFQQALRSLATLPAKG